MSSTLLPAIRSLVGDWITYITSMSFKDIDKLVKSPDEIHRRKGLSEWIQREAIDSHAQDIANYIEATPQRFLGSLIIGVYDGRPNWAPLNINFKIDQLELTEEQRDSVEAKLGLLHLSGDEKLFAIDGQHRVSGIKKAIGKLGQDNIIAKDEVNVIFVAHDESSQEGKLRTRRLFTTVNKKAKPISKSATIALDEDNGFAIVTRNLIAQHWLFEDDRQHISYTSTGSISPKDEKTITSVVGLYEITKDLYGKKKTYFESKRPNDSELEQHLLCVTTFLDEILTRCPELNEVFIKREKTTRYYREELNHLLFRPVGQRAFARATQLLISRGLTIKAAVSSLLEAEMNISLHDWHNILWDPIGENMITNKLALAETQLLKLCGHEARTNKHSQNLEELLELRD